MLNSEVWHSIEKKIDFLSAALVREKDKQSEIHTIGFQKSQVGCELPSFEAVNWPLVDEKCDCCRKNLILFYCRCRRKYCSINCYVKSEYDEKRIRKEITYDDMEKIFNVLKKRFPRLKETWEPPG